MSFWRAAGLNYVRYSQLCAMAVRRGLKPEAQAEAMKRDVTTIKAIKWKDGKAYH
uniref:Putative epsilon subunit of ATP synthetase n=1 Tax=Hydroides elegans TaxID=216498 RepID=A5LIM6_HYDEL|nr:putative epsilon subunit of ATP synthetase [Hydroides elegans]